MSPQAPTLSPTTLALTPVTRWRLRSGSERRFCAGHPWVYSNELQNSPKGIQPGDPVDLFDASGAFLARGFGNPHSLIAFRALSRDPLLASPYTCSALLGKLKRAQQLRATLGLTAASYRFCYGEADQLPGLVIDRYRLADHQGQVFVLQAHSAGMDRLLPEILQALEAWVREESRAEKRDDQPSRKPPHPAAPQGTETDVSWEKTGLVLRNDLGVRVLEGLSESSPQVIKDLPGVPLTQCTILVASASDTGLCPFQVDLVNGQKTGFFLDQQSNLQLAAQKLRFLQTTTTDTDTDACPPTPPAETQAIETNEITILDLFCYVGQWGAQLTRLFRQASSPLSTSVVALTAVDSSEAALQLARRNVETQGGRFVGYKKSAFEQLPAFAEKSFDVIVCDPPALIKTRKDWMKGKQAYLQLASQCLRLIKPQGVLIFCSCSSLLSDDTLQEILRKAAAKRNRSVQWIAKGGPSSDHPQLFEFPEGTYLKAWIGMVH